MLVQFPITDLDITDYAVQKPKDGSRILYDLYAITNHYGSMGGGHYTAYAKSCKMNKWYLFDDSGVSSADEKSIVTAAAYVLFYRRKDFDWGNDPQTNSTTTNTRANEAEGMCEGPSYLSSSGSMDEDDPKGKGAMVSESLLPRSDDLD
jgi:hypothetical protein